MLGILAVLAAACLLSTDRRHIRWRTVAWGLGLQVTFAFLVLRFNYRAVGDEMGGRRGQQYAVGDICGNASFVRRSSGFPTPARSAICSPPTYQGAIFAFQVLPTIIFISAFFAVLYHIGLMQIIIRGMAWIMLKTMRISGAESMNVAARSSWGRRKRR